MSKKKRSKKKSAPPAAAVATTDDNPAPPISESVESDTPGVARHSIEADFEAVSSDVERLDE
jgi:hypothetical protein